MIALLIALTLAAPPELKRAKDRYEFGAYAEAAGTLRQLLAGTPDLTDAEAVEAYRMLGIAERMVGDINHGRASLGERAASWLHQHRSNRANISHHYDVGDAFYRLWLDERMVYS